MLVDLGYELAEATSADEALRQLALGLSPDILITDRLMPGMNGKDPPCFVQGQHPSMPVLIVSGYVESDGVAPDLPQLTKPSRLRTSRPAWLS